MFRILEQKPIEQVFPKQWELFNNNGYTSLNEDALYKWAAILDIVDQFKPDSQTILDVGGGYAATTFLLSKEKQITNIDINYNGNWFNSNKGIISNLKDYNINNIEFKQLNFLSESDYINNDYYDIVIDGCSLIHFDPRAELDVKNIGLSLSADIISRKLKNDGLFIVSTDLNNEQGPESSEWLNAKSFVEIIQQSGFELIEDNTHQKLINSRYNVKNLGTLTIGAFAFKKI